MKGKVLAAIASMLVLGATACSPPAATTTTTTSAATSSTAPAADAKMGDMPMTSTAQTAGPIRSTGVVTQVDANAGTVTFDHQAIPAVNWPAMTMQFHAENPSILNGIAVGDHVAFELKSATETGVVTMVHKQ